jgi:glycosyltransferase involved in cell wall biosynthesis
MLSLACISAADESIGPSLRSRRQGQKVIVLAMPPLTALLHTNNDELRLGRCLETLYSCDHILIIDHNSQDATVHIAREYGARVVQAAPGKPRDQYAQSEAPGWILALDPREALTESLAASLFELRAEWRQDLCAHKSPVYSVFLREETADGWIELPAPETRLVLNTWGRWNGTLPARDPEAVALEGELLRFAFP